MALWLVFHLPQQVFLDFADGSVRITHAATDDATINASSIADAQGFAPTFAWQPMGSSRDAVVAEITATLTDLYAPFNVTFTSRRPQAGPYTMALIGGQGPDLGYPAGITGVGRVDCDNRSSSEIVFVFLGDSQRTPSQAAAVIAHELGHSFGLVHANRESDLMFPAVGSPGQTFEDVESQVLRTGVCGRSAQNSFQLLTMTLGRRVGRLTRAKRGQNRNGARWPRFTSYDRSGAVTGSRP
jgi:hypothetical protein